MKNTNIELLTGFMKLFEVVFDEDWDYSVLYYSMGSFSSFKRDTSEIENKTEEEQLKATRMLYEIFGEPEQSKKNVKETFIKAEESILDWKAKKSMLEAYFKVKEIDSRP